MELIDRSWLSILLATLAWSTLFSMFNRPAIRGWRNLGLLAGYGAGVAMFVLLPWRSAIVTWLAVALAAGALYVTYEVVSFARATDRDGAARPSAGPLLHALLLWPVMFPEAVEYLLAELGVLKAAAAATPDPMDGAT